MNTPPAQPKIYHILHMDRLASVINDGWLWSDVDVQRRDSPGTTIGINHIKTRRMQRKLDSHPELAVGDCVPFYFCPRSIMLFLLHKGNHPDLAYRGGQEPIVHLQADMTNVVKWAEINRLRWAFTLSNAGSGYFEDRANWERLGEINWHAIGATDFAAESVKEGKQAEFLIERAFPWQLVERVGVRTQRIYQAVSAILNDSAHRPHLEIVPEWYY